MNIVKNRLPAFIVVGILLFFSATDTVSAQQDFIINQFNSVVTINKEASVTVEETIIVEFDQPRHGIFRDIPVVYPNRTSTIKADFELLGVVDEDGNPYEYQVSDNRQVKSIRIGDPDIFVNGEQIYVIKYRLDDVLQEYEDHLELYWNVTGHEWQVNINNATATLESPHAEIVDVDCFGGVYQTQQKMCRASGGVDRAYFSSTAVIYPGSDFTIIAALDKNNELIFPGIVESSFDTFLDNIGYLLAVIPFLMIFTIWYKRGRDMRYISDNVYYTPEDTSEKTVSVFGRKFLPMVYHPIDDLTPGEVGTIIDEKVHISDVISEILELARLDYIKIQKLKKKGLLLSKDEYAFIKTEKTDTAEQDNRLSDYQKYLLKEIFRKANVLRSVKEAEKLFENKGDLESVYKQMAKYDYVLLSGLKNHFYEGLPEFKDKLYRSLDKENIFHGNPQTVRTIWMVVYIAVQVFFGVVLFNTVIITGNFYSIIIAVILGLVGLVFAYSMPRRTAKGYALKRQAEGFKWYLEKGKWRHEFAEKNLFIEEILPFAIALGVVDRLAADMKELGIKPPEYFGGATISGFTNDLSSFSSNTASSLTSAPRSSGSSSWSGGSGFSGGGSSGGGFGGGGGGSW